MLLCDVCSIVLWTRGPYEFPAAIVTGNWKWKCFFFFSRVPAAVLSVCSQWRPLPLFLTYCLIIPAAVMLASGKVISPPLLFCGLHNTTPLVYLFFFFIVKRRFSFLHTESILRGSGRNRSSFFFCLFLGPSTSCVFYRSFVTHERKKKKEKKFLLGVGLNHTIWALIIIYYLSDGEEEEEEAPGGLLLMRCYSPPIIFSSSSSFFLLVIIVY